MWLLIKLILRCRIILSKTLLNIILLILLKYVQFNHSIVLIITLQPTPDQLASPLEIQAVCLRELARHPKIVCTIEKKIILRIELIFILIKKRWYQII